jgi:hypothetical protein
MRMMQENKLLSLYPSTCSYALLPSGNAFDYPWFCSSQMTETEILGESTHRLGFPLFPQ